MFQEFAIEPELFATWGADFRFYCDKFGVGTRRYLVELPGSQWRRRVCEAIARLTGDLEKKRAEELYLQCKQETIRRDGIAWQDDASWIENACEANKPEPFRAIASRDQVLVEGKPGSLDDELTQQGKTFLVKREGAELARFVSLLLKHAGTVVFVDPHVDFAAPRYRKSFECFFGILNRNDKLRSVTLVGKKNPKSTDEQNHACCSSGVSRISRLRIPVRCRLFDGDRELHNRYILTNLGGVVFPHGLDEKARVTDDLTIMDRILWRERFLEYQKMTCQPGDLEFEVVPQSDKHREGATRA